MQEKNNPIGSTHFQSRLFSLCLTGLESVNGTTVLGKLDRQFTGRKQLSNSFTAVAIDSGNSSWPQSMHYNSITCQL